MKKKASVEKSISRKKVTVTFWGQNIVRYKSDIVVEVPDDAPEHEIVDVLQDKVWEMGEIVWEEHDEDGMHEDQEPDVWCGAEDGAVPLFILRWGDDGNLVAAPE